MLAAACDGACGLVASPEWEQRLGGLRLARVILQHRVRAPARARRCRSVFCWLSCSKAGCSSVNGPSPAWPHPLDPHAPLPLLSRLMPPLPTT